MKGFAELGVSEEFDSVLRNMGVRYPLPVQSASIGKVLKGQDLLVLSGTGTGKTLAYVLPAVQKVNSNKPYSQILILVPTRELVLQIAEVITKLAFIKKARVTAILGGRDFYEQKNKLDAVSHIIVGTPGRVLDHIRNQSVNLNGVKFLVLDEVDEMLQRGFLDDIKEIYTYLGKHQTLVCSATLPQQVVDLSKEIMQAAKLIDISKDIVDSENIEHIFIKVTEEKKISSLLEFLQRENPYLAIIFCSSKENAVKLEEELAAQNLSIDILQGDMSQSKRNQVMKRFREAKIQFLVATDLAARGLDVKGVTHVINYDLPHDAQQYIHRVGRTGRVGEKGVAASFYGPTEQKKVRQLEEKLGLKFIRANVAGQKLASAKKKNRFS